MPVIDVAEWGSDEEHPFFPEGSRDKRLLRCPDPPPFPFLIAGHRYLFKKSRLVYPEQFWAEVVAHRIGVLAGIEVPPTYAAWDSNSGDSAALIEWFYGYPGRPRQGFLSGGMFMKSVIRDYDMKRGRQHNFGHIELVCRSLASGVSLSGNAYLESEWPMAWARMLAFDALTGNTDRHHENWGFIVTRIGLGARFSLSPAFDNGTSLGHERPKEQFQRFEDAHYLRRYIENGHHHMRWQLSDARPAGHAELLL